MPQPVRTVIIVVVALLVPGYSDHTLEARPGEWEWAHWSETGRL